MTPEERQESIRLLLLTKRFCDQCKKCENGNSFCKQWGIKGLNPNLAVGYCESTEPPFQEYERRED